MKRGWKTTAKMLWKGGGYSFVVALLIATSFKSAIADWNVVPTGSMKPTIVEGDRIFVNKLAYDLKIPYTTLHVAEWGDPNRGDIVVFYSPADGTRLVKRVVGLPGEVVAMHANRLIINGEAVPLAAAEPPGEGGPPDKGGDDRFLTAVEDLDGRHHPLYLIPGRPALRTFQPVRVPPGHYFVLGDNRDNSADSRYFGFVARHRIVGRATSVVASLDINWYYRPRWDRFFTRLP